MPIPRNHIGFLVADAMSYAFRTHPISALFPLIRIKEYNFMAKTKALQLFHNLKKTVSYAHVNAKLLIIINNFEKQNK